MDDTLDKETQAADVMAQMMKKGIDPGSMPSMISKEERTERVRRANEQMEQHFECMIPQELNKPMSKLRKKKAMKKLKKMHDWCMDDMGDNWTSFMEYEEDGNIIDVKKLADEWYIRSERNGDLVHMVFQSGAQLRREREQ